MRVGSVQEIWRYPVKSMVGERLDASEVGPQGLWGDRGWAVRNETTGEIHNAKRFPTLLQCRATYREAPGPNHIPHVDVTMPDGRTYGSDSPILADRLSELMGRRVSLRPLQPANDKAFYRRHEPGAGLIARLARHPQARRVLQWGIEHGFGGGLRHAFGREPGEPLPDLTGIPAELFEFYTPPGTYFDVFPIHVLTSASLELMARHNPAAAWDVRRFRPNVLVRADADATESEWVGRAVRIGGFAVKGEMPTIRCAMPMHAQPGVPRDPSVLRTIVRDAAQCLGLYASVVRPGRVAVADLVELTDKQ